MSKTKPSPQRTVRSKSIYKPKEYGDGIRILITRFYPRGVKKTHFDRWLRDLAPSVTLLQKYKNQDITWGQFMASFRLELQGNDNSMRLIKTLNARSSKRNMTLLCYEPEGVPCHRHMLKEIIREPDLLAVGFEPEYADYHKRCSVSSHVVNKRAWINSEHG